MGSGIAFAYIHNDGLQTMSITAAVPTIACKTLCPKCARTVPVHAVKEADFVARRVRFVPVVGQRCPNCQGILDSSVPWREK